MALSFEALKASQLANPPVYNEQGMVTNAIPVDTLQSAEKAITVPTSTLDTTKADASVAGSTQTSKSLDAYIKELTPPATAESTQADTLSKQLMDLVGQDTGKAAALQTAETTAGVPQFKQQLSDINGQVLTGNAEYQQLKAAYDKVSVENRNKPISMSSIIGNESQINYARLSELNSKAADINLLVARGQALQGNITAAQETAAKAVAIQYEVIEDQIRVKEAQLAILAPILNKQEQIRAYALQLMYADQKERLATQKTNDIQMQNIGIAAAANGASQTQINAALATKDPIQATQMLSQYIKGNLESSTTTGLTQGTMFKVPTAKELGGAQFYKYPSGPQVYTSNGTSIDLAKYKELTGQTGVADADVNFSGIKTMNPTSTTPTGNPPTGKYTISTASQEIKDQWAQGYIQGNGKISSTDYKAAKSWWISQGLSATSFDQTFIYLIDQSSKTWKTDYAYKGN